MERNQNRYFCREHPESLVGHILRQGKSIFVQGHHQRSRTQGLSLYGGVRRWQSGHSDRSGTGFSGTKFYTLHFNGPNNGQGNYIWSQAGVVAWAAEPVFDENAGTIQLVFSDNGQGNGREAKTLCFWENNDRYWSFTGQLCLTNALELSKTTNRLRMQRAGRDFCRPRPCLRPGTKNFND